MGSLLAQQETTLRVLAQHWRHHTLARASYPTRYAPAALCLRRRSQAHRSHRGEQDDNRSAAVAAARTIEVSTTETLGDAGVGARSGARAGYLIDLSEPSAGVVIQIIQGPAPMPAHDPEIIDVTPEKLSTGLDN